MNRVMNLKGFLLIVALMLVFFLIFYGVLQGKLTEKKTEEDTLRVRLSRLEDENRELTSRLDMVGTEEYIVSSAIEDYSYMNKDDIRFAFTNPEALYAYTEEELKILMDEMTD